MSRGDIPIIVDACISFVTQHGEWVLADTELVRDGEHGHCRLDGIEEGDVPIILTCKAFLRSKCYFTCHVLCAVAGI